MPCTKLKNGGNYFLQEIIPFLYKQIIAERNKDVELTVLTEREREILEMIAQELTSDEIAAKLLLVKRQWITIVPTCFKKPTAKAPSGL